MWNVLRNQKIFSAEPWFEVTKQTIKLPDGRLIDDYYQINQPSYCEIAVKDKNGLILIHETYKHGVRDITLAFPGGYILDNERPQTAAMRELHEECSLTAQEWTHLGSYVIDGNRSQAKVHLYMAEGITAVEKIPSDDLEEAKPLWVDKVQLKSFVNDDCFKTLGARLLAEKIINGI